MTSSRYNTFMDKNDEDTSFSPSSQRKHTWLALSLVIFTAMFVGVGVLFVVQYTLKTYLGSQTGLVVTQQNTEPPTLTEEVVASGLLHPWDIAFLPDGRALFTQRAGTLSLLHEGNVTLVSTIDDVQAGGEGGLLGLAIDRQFSENHYIYLCYNSTSADVRVVRWKLGEDLQTLNDRHDIITGISANPSGRHSGCRLQFGPDGYLWVGTGDAAMANTTQNPNSLGGKILRVDRDGVAAPNNMSGDFDNRIYSYGHRNTQGIAFSPEPINGIVGYSVEHGSSVDDEVNPLVTGNFGWNPAPPYNESGVPMTDTTLFPEAIEAAWKSGSPTQAPSGATFLHGTQWKAWNGALVIAMLKAQHLKLLLFDSQGNVASEQRLLTDQGRLRAVQQAPDGSLYITTDNGQNDRIIRLSAQ